MSGFYGSNLDQQPDERSWHPRFGWQIRRAWKGSPAAIEVMIAALQNDGTPFVHVRNLEGGYEMVVGDLSGQSSAETVNTPLTNDWALLGNDIEKDLWLHPKVSTVFNDARMKESDGSPTPFAVLVKNDIKALLEGDKELEDVEWWNDLGELSYLKQFVRCLLQGFTSYTVSQFVVRNVKIVAANYDVKPDYEKVGKVLTTSELASLYNPPATIKFALPEGKWLERTPSVQPSQEDKWAITREWWHGDTFEEFIYSPI